MIPNAAWRKREERKRTKDNLEERAIFEITWFVDATKLERTRRMCFVLCVLRERERESEWCRLYYVFEYIYIGKRCELRL